MDGRPVFNVEVPVLAGDTVLYVLIMSFRADHIANLIKRPNLGSPWINGVTDTKGIILARSERHDEFVGKPLPPELLEHSRDAKGVFRATNVAGADILRATVRSQIAGWLETLRRVFGKGERAALGTVKSMIGHAMPAAGVAGLIKAALALHRRELLPTLRCKVSELFELD